MADPLTDASEFTVLAAAWTLDRQKDQIRRRAFAESITAWKASEKQIPLHWDHSGDPADIVGTVDSQSLAETDQGRFVSGRLHLEESARAREIWGSVKSGAISLSFGYLIKRSRKRNDGTRESLSLDLFEVSLTPSPANGDTRILSTKVRRANSARQLRGRVMEGDAYWETWARRWAERRLPRQQDRERFIQNGAAPRKAGSRERGPRPAGGARTQHADRGSVQTRPSMHERMTLVSQPARSPLAIPQVAPFSSTHLNGWA